MPWPLEGFWRGRHSGLRAARQNSTDPLFLMLDPVLWDRGEVSSGEPLAASSLWGRIKVRLELGFQASLESRDPVIAWGE